jgi:hypothetical protein
VSAEFSALHKTAVRYQIDDVSFACDTETIVFNSRYVDGQIQAQFEGVADDGRAVRYPDIATLGDAQLDYLIDRLNSAMEPQLHCLYAHQLWASSRKHHEFAEAAIASYLKWASTLLRKKQDDQQRNSWILVAVKNAFYISKQMRSKKAHEVDRFIIRLICSYSPKRNWAIPIKIDLTKLVLENRRRFDSSDLIGIADALFGLAATPTTIRRVAIDAYRLAAKVDARRNLRTRNWLLLEAEAWETLMRQRPPGDLARLTFADESVRAFRRAREFKKCKEIQALIEAERTEIRLSRHQFEFDGRELYEQFLNRAKQVVSWPSHQILAYLVISKEILPSPEKVREQSIAANRAAVLVSIFPTAPMDRWGNTIAHYSSAEELESYHMREYYEKLIELSVSKYLLILSKEISKSNAVTFRNLIKHFKRDTWIGKPTIQATLPEEMYSPWLEQIGPSIRLYCEALNRYAHNKPYHKNCMNFSDTIITKFEGLCRQIARFHNIQVFEQSQDHHGRLITVNRGLADMLYEDGFCRLFDDETVYFLRWLLVDRGGMNLRNRVAHSDMMTMEYSMSQSNLLMLALFRLLIHNVKLNSDDSS